ncbi:hypothetical protein AB0G02_33950 [Actinosynnema sp. NPDC023658]|uniref:hypothetical protein n=1 Tax=Actinosynnema sp. NPDC023658 TaxID=3155465 RepID=UPI0033D2A91A
MPLRLTYLGVTNAFALPRLLPMSDRDEDMEILTLRQQIMVLERQLGNARPRVTQAARNLAMDSKTRAVLIRDRDGKYPVPFDTALAERASRSSSPVSGYRG